MKVKGFLNLIISIIAAGSVVLAFAKAESVSAQNTIYVPDDYPAIQQAVDAAQAGDRIVVRAGCYSENIKVNKSGLAIVSENGPESTFINAANPDAAVFELNRSRTEISGFTIRGTANSNGIEIKYSSTENKIKNNIIRENKQGIYISLYSYLNEITGNVFRENDYDLYLQEAWDSGSGALRKSSANSIYLNDFYGKIYAGTSGYPYYNFWKTPEFADYSYNDHYFKNHLGNFYVFYTGTDANNDGIGDTPQALNGESDAYPLTVPFSNYQVLTEEPEWTFAVLTDLHIGWGIPDYGEQGYNDNTPGQDYYMTDRLQKTVDWINAHCHDKNLNIKFVAVLGDISDTAERSEFLKAREILNKLEIPYIPLIGNHDIWPYISNPNYEPDRRTIFGTPIKLGMGKTAEPGEEMGDQSFEKIFWQENQTNVNKINGYFDNFTRSTGAFLQNSSFEYNNIKFISLDFASRDKNTQLFGPLNATNIESTINFLRNQLTDCGNKKIVILTHYPLDDYSGGFELKKFDSIETLLLNSNCRIINFAGHIHINKSKVYDDYYKIAESESLSQVGFNGYNPENRFLRILKPSTWTDLLDDSYDNFVTFSPPAINPYITMSPADVGRYQYVTFDADTKNRDEDQITFYTWQFDDDKPFTTHGDKTVKLLEKAGKRTVKLTVTDAYGIEETIGWDYYVKTDFRPARIMMINGTYIPMMYTGAHVNETENAQNTREWITISKDDLSLIGAIDTHFEIADANIDLSDFTGDTDLISGKSFMHMDNWPSVIEDKKILYIPSTGKDKVYICPEADSLTAVQPNCQNASRLTVGEEKDGMSLQLFEHNGQQYYQVYGITGTGGGELRDDDDTDNENALENQIQITRLDYDSENILEKIANDIGDKHLPLLLSELKQVKINLTSFLPNNKKTLQPAQTKKLDYKLKFLESIGNEWQGKKLKVWFDFQAKQEK